MKPTIVCLCGSTKFYKEYESANISETMQGKIVLTVGFFLHHYGIDAISYDTKVMLDELHKRKIDLAEEILVLNVDGYIGESTRSEIDYAIAHNKKIRYLEKVQ